MNKHCQNPTCFCFASDSHIDLNGAWCSDECFIEFESGTRPTRRELLEMKVDYDWDLDEFEKQEVIKMNIVKSESRLSKD